MADAVRAAHDQFATAGLAFPSIPESIPNPLRQIGAWSFSTRADTPWPYMVTDYVREFTTDEQPSDYAVVAHAGRGSASWALSSFVVADRLGTFVHSNWGDSYSNDDQMEQDRQRFAARIGATDQLRDAITTQPLGPDERLGIVVSDLHGCRWAHWHAGTDIAWTTTSDALAAGLEWLNARG